MGKRVAVVTDSIACIPRDLLEKYRISVIPLNFYANGRVYRDGIDVTPSEAYKLFLKDPETFKTSGASPQDCIDAYSAAAKKGKDVFSVILSSRLSAIYSTAEAAGKQVQEELRGVTVAVLDSRTAAAAEGLIALAAARVADAGKSLAEVKTVAEKVRDKVQIIAYMDTVRYIYRSGRIPRIASIAGSMLKIRPLFTFAGGMPLFAGAVRSKATGIKRLLESMNSKVNGRPVHVAVMHVYAEDDAARLKDRVAKDFNCAELWLTEFSPSHGLCLRHRYLGAGFLPRRLSRNLSASTTISQSLQCFSLSLFKRHNTC